MSQDQPSLDELTDRAEKLEDDGLRSDALEAWERALQYYTTPYLLYRFGRLALELAKWTEAEKALLSAIDLAPEFPLPYTSLGVLYIERNEYPSAEIYLRKGLEIEEGPVAYTLLGVAQRHQGMATAAIDSFREAININPSYEEAYYNLGITIRPEQPAEAITLFRQAVKLDPEYAIAHRELGWALRQLENYTEAEYHLQRAIELDDSDGWTYVYLGNLLWTKRDLAAAEQAFKTGIEVWPDDSLTHWCLAHFYEYQGRTQEADFFYETAVQLEPDDEVANLRFGLFLKDIGENAKAKVHLERVLSLEPDNEQARLALDEIE